MDAKDKERVLVEVVQRVLAGTGSDPQRVEQAIFDTLYEERRRLETEPHDPLAREQTAFYEHVHAQALRADPLGQRKLLAQMVQRFADEVAGHFDPRVYAAVTRVVPTGLSLLLNALSPLKLARSLSHGFADLDEQLEIVGEVPTLQRLVPLGTLVLVPTHSSNLDSIIMGYAIYRMGLPPHLYGAGLNLFRNELVGFFMRHLGAYKVDRRKHAAAYKEVLKTYAGCTMELGYHNLFFPGGTRSRSGAVERRLKLGLLGMALDAYLHNLLAHKPKPDVFVVPCTINYELVLEAETLICDHLKEAGKARYIIEDDEFSKPRRILDFVKKLLSLCSRIHVVVGAPLDVFGNRVLEDGTSVDARGRSVDRTRYVVRHGSVRADAQRDGEYTRELAAAVVDSYRRNTMPKSTNLVARVVFSWLRERGRGLDLYRLLRTGGAEDSLPLVEAHERVDRALHALRDRASRGRVRLAPSLRDADVPDVVSKALAHLGSYHRRAALERRGDRLFHQDRNLLLFYQNRLDGYELGVPGTAA
ncbi:MAG: 1-acyl-sn-glycerol-3-phosphate acyltransferase [Deltaproteobacteria bacterium]|nr:1-acyl-sn-glycerol-3-phosphate acyltransferase [Deltaproteobacteria bacterium]